MKASGETMCTLPTGEVSPNSTVSPAPPGTPCSAFSATT